MNEDTKINPAQQKSRIQPTWSEIENFRTPLTQGEKRLALFLDKYMPPDWEIYVQPFLNGDRPDIVILNPDVGLVIFEVKDWKEGIYSHRRVCPKPEERENTQEKTKRKDYLQYFFYDEKNRQHHPIPSPVSQVERYRRNLIDMYVPRLGKNIDQNKKKLNFFKTALYFHKMDENNAQKLCPDNYCNVFGSDTLDRIEKSIEKKIKKKISSFDELNRIVPYFNIPNTYINREIVGEIRCWLRPPIHFIEHGKSLKLSKLQQVIAQPQPRIHQKLRGAAGSGKSMIIAQRASLCASQGKQVLVVTYNMTLWHYIRDFMVRCAVVFDMGKVTFAHFHGFCMNFLMENDIVIPPLEISPRDPAYREAMDEYINMEIPLMVQDTLTMGKNCKNRKYDTILIDEAQDFERLWYETLCRFLTENDEVLLCVDERQNVYRRQLDWINGRTNEKLNTKWIILRQSYRLPPPIIREANRFSRMFLSNVGIVPEPADEQLLLFNTNHIWVEIKSFHQASQRILNAFKFLILQEKHHASDIAILVPTHREGWELVELFGRENYQVNHVFEEPLHHHKKSFWMGDSRVKMCTYHSFKGWEINNVIIITPTQESKIGEDFDFLLYMAITRTRENLIVFNRHTKYTHYGKEWKNTWTSQQEEPQ